MNAGGDPEMLELFRAEMDAHLPVLGSGLLALEKGEVSAQEIEAMMRAAHSIKGAARIVGIEPAVRVSHIMEDCFTAAKEGRVALSSGGVDVLLEGVDALQRICTPDTEESLSEAALDELLNKIKTVRDGTAAIPVAAVPVQPVPAVPARSERLVAATVDRDEPSITLPAAWDEPAALALRSQMLDTLLLQPATIRLDFAHVGKLSAGAMALLASFAREVSQSRPAPVIETVDASDSVRNVLRVSGLGVDFGIVPSA